MVEKYVELFTISYNFELFICRFEMQNGGTPNYQAHFKNLYGVALKKYTFFCFKQFAKMHSNKF